MKCIHIGNKAGSVITACCGGGERFSDMYICNESQRPEKYAVPNVEVSGNAPVLIGENRTMERVAGCVRCPFFKSDQPLPSFGDLVPKGNAYRMWEDLRKKRIGVNPVLEPIVECFRTYVPQESTITTRHLLYHIWPKQGSVWRDHLERVERRLSLFNGKKIVAIAEDEDTDHVDIPWADKVIRTRNIPQLREVVTFLPMLEEIKDMGPNEAAFNCHSKGVTHEINHGTTVHLWTDIMMEVMLDHWPYVAGLLESTPIAGAFKKVGRSLAPTSAEWHYTGTYYWFRNDVFSRNWRNVDQVYWGTESWPGVHFNAEEGGCAFLSGSPAILNLYDMNFVLREVVPRLELFRELMQGYRQ